MVRETRHLWVGNLPETVREDRIREHFKRYGRVQSVKILLSSNCNPNLLLSIGSSSVPIKDHNDSTDDHSISMYNFNNNVSLCSPTTNSTNCTIGGSVCATVAFMDIKSASKAHTAEHKFDDRVLTTEYYEPSSIPSTSGENSPSSISSLTNTTSAQQQTAQQQQQQQPSPQHGSTTSNLSGSVQQSVQQQYSSSTTVSPPAAAHRLSTSNHGSSEDLSPNFDRNIYDRSTRLSESSASDMYIRRPNYHHSDSRGRPRDRHYRNGSYSSTVDRSNSSILHRSSSNTWYENSNVTNASRNVYGNLPSAAVVVTPDSAYDTTTDRRTSETECSSKSITKNRGLIKKKKSRSGSESPCGDSTTSRSNSRSPSCSSTNSGSSHSHGSSSPTSSDKSRVRNLQSAVSTPATNSSSNSNPAVHSEDNRPLAICVRNLPSRSSDTSLKDGLFHEYKKHGKVTWVKVVGQSSERYALVCFKKPEDVVKALEVSHDKLFFGCKIAVAPYQGFDVDDNEFRPYEAELDEYHPKATRTLFIGNLEKDITATELRKNFDCFGEIIEIDIKKQGVNAYAFCQYSDIVSVVKAMRQMDGEHLGSTRIKLGFGKSMPTNCVWIDGVSDAASESYLTTQFNRFGPVSQVTIQRERKMALVFFEQISYAQMAVKEMRGVTLRGRKLQVDFASRECQDAFYDKIEKKSAVTPERTVFEPSRDVTRTFENSTTTLNSRFSRYDTPARSRTSSFSRHGAVSPSSATTPRGSSFVRRNSRYANADYHDDEYAMTNTVDNRTSYTKKNAAQSMECDSERRIKSYDEYSQGSAASHDADEYNYFRTESPQERISVSNELDSVTITSRRKYDDEFSYAPKKNAFIVNDMDADRREKSPVIDDEYFSSTVKHHRVQSVVVSADSAASAAATAAAGTASTHANAHFQQPGDIRHLQKERSQLLEQLEECPSSGDEILSPKKRMKFDNADSGNLVQTNLVNDSNCDATLNNLNDTNLLQHHRKNSEVRRLSECNSSKHNVVNNIRRPSTDSGSLRHPHVRTGSSSHNELSEQISAFQSHPFCKRRKTGNSNSESEHHSSKGRGHQLHSHHSHEASASESADGSRPGTPLCDERPEIMVPADPRRNSRDRYTSHSTSLYLPLPKFGVQIFQQNRAFSSTHSLSSYLLSSHSSRNTLSSPPPALLTRPSSNGSTILLSSSAQQQQHSHQHNFQPKHSHQSERSSLHQTHQPSSAAAESKPSSHHQPPPPPPPPLPSVPHSVSTSQTAPPAPPAPSSSTSSSTSLSIATPSAPSDAKQSKLPQVQSTESQIKPVNTATLLKQPMATEPIEQPPESPCKAPSLSSTSSDSELGKSPSFDERIKNLDEMFEMWNGGIPARPSSHSFSENPTTPSSASSFSSRHKFLELDVNDVKPSDILKSVLSKKSIFDDDLKRLEHIGEKYEPKDYLNLNRTPTTANATNSKPAAAAAAVATATVTTTPTCTSQLTQLSQLPKLHSTPQQTTTTFTAQISQALPRLNAVSPMNSPQPQSPYNSPSPSPIVVTPNMSGAKMSNNIASVQPVKGVLQYPFPTHPPIATSVTNLPSTPTTPSNKIAENTSSSQDQDSNKSKSHKSTSNTQEKNNQASNGSKSSNRSLNKSASVPGSNHSGTVRTTLTSSCSLNMSIKDESNDSLENVIPSRKTSREEKISNAKNDHAKKTDLLDRRKWESISSENSDPASSSEILSERTENERVGRERHDSTKMESGKTKNKTRNQSEIESQERDESRIKYELESKKSEEYEYRRREMDSDDAVHHNWKQEYKQNPPKDREHVVTVNQFTKSDKHNKENASKSRESTPLDRQQYTDEMNKNSSKNSRSNSPNKIIPKRRLSSHESVDSDDGKRFKFNSENVKSLERRDFKDPNGRTGGGGDKSSSKHHQRNFNKMNNVHKTEENSCDMPEDRSKKDSSFDERKKERDGDKQHRSKSEKSSHKSRRNKDEKSSSQFHMEAQSGFSNDGRLSDDESSKKSENKDGRRENLFDAQQQHHHQQQQQQQQHQQHPSHRHHSHEKQNSRDHRDEKSKSEKRIDRLNSSEKRSRTTDDAHSSAKSSMERERIRIHDGPAYISMYDKVKARSCKNMQKQEEEKKIKAKFSQLKESRAKREGKKHSNSYDEESDSDMDTNEQRVKHTGGKMKHFLDSSTEDSDGRHSMNKDLVSDSESSSRKGHFRVNRLNELCDGESSENSSLHQFSVKPRRRISSRKNSRSARITSETSDDASEIAAPVKQEPREKPDEEMKCEIKTEIVNIPKEEKQDIVQFKIKSEPVDPFPSPERTSNLCDLSDGDSITPSSKTSETKESMFDNLFSAENKKRHKKNKKRQKSPSAMSTEEAKPIKHEEMIKVEKSNSMETMFDELKRDARDTSSNEKKRHGKKEKKRDKSSKEQHDKSREEKYRMKKLKKQNRLSSDASMFESQESFNSIKRGEKMEDIFGPISDDDSHISATIDTHKSTNKSSNSSNNVHSNKSSTQSSTTTTTTTTSTYTQNENNTESKSSNLQLEKEKHREKKREKKRKEREKQQQSISSKDDDNSVDLDAAARALEAQLLEDSEQKPEEISDFGYSASKENVNKNESVSEKPYDDVFRFSETEEGPDNMFMSRKSDSMDSHRSKDKKKKKKRSKEEKRHHHHHLSHSSSFISPPTTPRLTIDTDLMDDLPPSKQSPISIDDSKSSEEPIEPKGKDSKTIDNAQSSKHSDDKRKDSKAIIPDFGLIIDTNIYDSAVQSISSDFANDKSEPEKLPIEENPTAESQDAKQGDKIEEKSRVVISQEETEDAVAALLGESFGMTDDYSFSEDPIIEEGSNLPSNDGAIAEEEAEEMRKAVQSLGTDDMDMKPDTPQSDNGLQIDTDTEEQDDSNALQIDESAANYDSKSEAPKDKKSTTKDVEPKASDTNKNTVAFTLETVQSQETSKNADKPASSSDNHKTTIVTTQPKLHVEPPILPPIIPKIEAPSELLSVTISTPTLAKPNIIQVSSISNDKPKSSPPSTIIHHTQPSVVTQTMLTTAATASAPTPPTSIQNPILNRVTTPQIRQSLHMSPAKSSLSHVNIQQRQIIPPATTIQTTQPHKPSATNVTSSNRTSSVVVPTSDSKSNEVESPKHAESEPTTTITPSTLVSTQMPQTPKQIVFETKIQQEPDVRENKPSKPVDLTPVVQTTEESTENSKQDDVPLATTSVIKSILSKPEEVKTKEEISESSSTMKEDSEYWTAKEVNIESVIKEVDALCTTDDETNAESKVIVKPETPKTEAPEEIVEKNESKEAAKTDAKGQPKREKATRNKKTQQIEVESQKSPPSVMATPEVQSPGVQTRRGVTAKPTVQTRRGRNNRNASPRSKTGASVVVGNEKPCSNTSESDIYEFHEDSGEETMAMQSNEAPRTRALSFSKPSTQPSSPITPPQVEPSKADVSAPEPEPPKPVQSPEVEKSNESVDETKEDLVALNNLRKSRRLIERDGSRSTVDDTIEEVVKNIMKEQTVITTTSATIVQPQLTSTPIQTRRSTRNTTNQATVKLPVNEKAELRKSPRPTRGGAKDIKSTETESSADDKSEDTQRSDVHEEKRDNDSEATQSASESGETNRTVEPPKAEPVVVEAPKVHSVAKELPPAAGEKKQPSSGEPMTLIDPVTGEMTVVQQSNEGQYVPVVSSRSGEFVNKPSVLVTSREVRPIAVEPTPAIVSKVSTAPVVTIVSKPVPVPISLTVPIPMPMPMPVQTTAPMHVQKSTVVITSKPVEPPTHTVPLSMSIEKTLAQPSSQPQIKIQPVLQTPQQQPLPPPSSQHQHHSLKAHVLSSQHVKMSQAPVISSAGTPVILSTSVPSVSHVSNVQPVIKSTAIIQSSVVQPNIPSHKYGKDSPASVISQQQQYQPKIQVSVAQQQQQQQQPPPHLSVAHKNTLIVNIPTSSPANMPSAHSPRHSPNIPPKVTYTQASIHEPQYSIHVPKHSVANIHPSQMLSQKPVVIHSNKMHMPPTSSNYTSVVQCSGKVIQTSHHLPQPAPLIQMGPAQPVPLQHISQQPQQTKSSSSHQISIQSTQPAPFVSSVPLQVRSSASKYETAPSPKYKQHILPPTLPQIQTSPASIQQQSVVAKQSTFPPQSMPTSNQIRLHQASQIMTGAVASPPPKQPHLSSQQPIVAGANSSRASVPPLSPQGQQNRPHNLQQPGLPVPGFEANLHSDIGGFSLLRNQSPPPAHQQASPITPVNLSDPVFPNVPMRGVQNNHFILYQQYMRAQEALGHGARIPYIPRSTMLPNATEQKELNELEEPLGTSPPLELRRPITGQRVAVPHSLQSPQDRATVIPHPHYPDVGARFYDNARPAIPTATEPPPAHRNPQMSGTPPINYAAPGELPPHLMPKALEREREQREKERKSSIPGHTNTPCPSGLVPAMATPGPGRSLQVTTPPHASQVPPQADSLLMLLQRYPVMWQGLLALKTDQAAVQMHFVFGNPDVASGSLPCNSDGSTPPLRIAQRMRLEQTQLEGVARKMQTDNEHCMLLALPCGRDHLDVLQQSTNLQTGFITYLQQKQAAGIVNIPAPGSEQAAYVVHIFPSCEFANENLARIAPDLLHRVADIAHLLIVIATV
ncbi:protein split ends isoform X2 [Sitodiplosis mosellana]|uniref:protein split ends isoform X2 n=1 Tax=Sitodiplosis mosellana TaxID=263140 RepID=UPI002444D98A|nr:protein split ends isoform X2 [Sitodiplosis mosellana]